MTFGSTLGLTPKIGVYGICKDESLFIDRCLASIEEADVISFCDTGSTDDTVNKLENFSKDYHSNTIITQAHVDPWRFDDARNIALFSLPADVDICVSIDADELLEPGWYEKLSAAVMKDLQATGKTADRYNHRFRTIWDWRAAGTSISEHWHERIHARHGFRWKLPVHEVLVKVDGTLETVGWIPELMMTQLPETSKARIYLPMLEQSAKEDPKRWKTFSFLAGEYQNAGKHDNAHGAIDHALKLEDSDKAFLSYQKSGLYKLQGDVDMAINEMQNACRHAPHVREYRVYLAQVYLSVGRRADAIATLEAASKITVKTTGYEYNASCWGDVFYNFVKSINEQT